MSDQRRAFTYDLESAKYLNSEQAEVEPTVKPPVRRAPAKPSRLEQASRCISPIVGVLLLAAIGGWFWLNHASLSSGVESFRERTSNPIDMALWIGGSKHTARDIIVEAQRNSQAEFEKLNSGRLKTSFDDVDLSNLSSQFGGSKR